MHTSVLLRTVMSCDPSHDLVPHLATQSTQSTGGLQVLAALRKKPHPCSPSPLPRSSAGSRLWWEEVWRIRLTSDATALNDSGCRQGRENKEAERCLMDPFVINLLPGAVGARLHSLKGGRVFPRQENACQAGRAGPRQSSHIGTFHRLEPGPIDH